VQGKGGKACKTRAEEENAMYKRQSKQVSMFEEETLFGGVKLDSKNPWIGMAKMIPWASVEERYAETFDGETGKPAKSARMAIGALVIRERYGFSDEDTLQEIRMNPYLQYFIGLSSFQHEAPFDQSTMTLFRRRVSKEMLAELNDFIIGRGNPYAKEDDESGGGTRGTDGSDGSGGADGSGGSGESSENTEPSQCQPSEPAPQGTMTLDATCAPQEIHFPTDIRLLNEAREALEAMIDTAYGAGEKPRTYRRKARKEYLKYARNRKPTSNLLRKSLRKQPGYVARDLGYLERVLNALTDRQLERLAVVRELYAQQREMYDEKKNRVDDRIVSLHEPWVRPIVRGKAGTPVEFGAKVAISLVGGYSRIEDLRWDAFAEGGTLIASAEAYRRDYGRYPARILGDKSYRTRENLQYCKEHGIRMSGPKLGRPPKDKAVYRQQLREEWLESGERAAIECEFGVGKRRYTLDLITTRLQHTSEVAIHVVFLTMNLWKRVHRFLCTFFICYFQTHFRVWLPCFPSTFACVAGTLGYSVDTK